MKYRILFATTLLSLMYLASVIIPKASEAIYKYNSRCPCKGNYEGQRVVIRIDGRGAIVNSVGCSTLELKYFADGRYRYSDFEWYEIE
jgi:hypothetical protein